jgi:hypothetical protein
MHSLMPRWIIKIKSFIRRIMIHIAQWNVALRSAACIVLFVAMLTAVPAAGQQQILHSAPELHPPLATVANPGPLCAAHASLEGLDHCADCHLIAREEGTRKCLACHEIIELRRSKKIGYHGRFLEGSCTECHSDHQGLEFVPIELDPVRFNHALSQFPLEGKHLSVQCDGCHRAEKKGTSRFRFLGLPLTCTGCHSTPHSKQVSMECKLCHSASGWKGRAVAYNHAKDFGYPLRGAHSEVQCVQCHPKGWGKVVSTKCSDCHTDIHQGRLGAACESCHDEQRWANATMQFDHVIQTGYALEGKHVGLECMDCHPNPTYAGASRACASCHASPHGEQISDQCVKCHTVWSWGTKYLAFDHEKSTGYKLGVLHQYVTCAACHPAGSYKVDDTTCEGCHEAVQGFRVGESAFESGRRLADPMLELVRCTDCHNLEDAGARLSVIRRRCVDCHPQSYGQLLSHWEEKLDRESRELLHRMAGWIKHVNKETHGTGAPVRAPTGIQISLSEMSDTVQQLHDAVERLGVHNLRNAERELEAARQRFKQVQTLSGMED